MYIHIIAPKMTGSILTYASVFLFLLLGNLVDGCPSGWVNNGTKCYHFSHDLENWPDAMVMCRIYGGYLAEIITATEDSFLEGYTQKMGKRYWVGAADTINEREWLWMTSKTIFTYNNWLPGNPDNGYGGNENCLEINYQGYWNDAECKELKQYICEIEAEYVP